MRNCQGGQEGEHGKMNDEIDSFGVAAEMNTAKLTDFRRKVYTALMKVPRGRVTTYGALARRIGCRSAQAVGQALKANPFAPQVPCHRVVAADGSLGGFCGERGGQQLARKRRMLESEGVRFASDGKVASDALILESHS